jgi:serine/threonine protein phosphatase PrpC
MISIARSSFRFVEGRMSKAKQVNIRIAARTDIGLVRERNEDSIVLADLTNGEREARAIRRIGPAGVLFGVCDGMGGAAAGEIASQIAAQVLVEQMTNVQVSFSDKQFSKAFQRAVEAASEAIQANAKQHLERKGMGTTCTALATRGDRLFIAQVGDSRAYLLRQGTLKQLTKDQTLAHALRERGHLSEEQLANYQGSNPVLQVLGATEDLGVEMTELAVEPGDRLMVCSDGLHGLVNDEAIASVLTAKRAETACNDLVEMARAAGGRDNISVVVTDIDSPFLTRTTDFASVLGFEHTASTEPTITAQLHVPMTFGARQLWALGALLLVLVGTAVGFRYMRASAAQHAPSAVSRPVTKPSHAATKPKPVSQPNPSQPRPEVATSAPSAVDAAVPIAPQVVELPAQRKVSAPSLKPIKKKAVEPRVITLPAKPAQELVPPSPSTPEQQKKWIEEGDPFRAPF